MLASFFLGQASLLTTGRRLTNGASPRDVVHKPVNIQPGCTVSVPLALRLDEEVVSWDLWAVVSLLLLGKRVLRGGGDGEGRRVDPSPPNDHSFQTANRFPQPSRKQQTPYTALSWLAIWCNGASRDQYRSRYNAHLDQKQNNGHLQNFNN